jgi:hypothetical protein
LLDYALTEHDEFGMIFRRTVSADKINERFVSSAILLPDKSLKVISYDMIILDDGYFKFRRDSKLDCIMAETIVPAGLWCINVYDADGCCTKKLTSDTFA